MTIYPFTWDFGFLSNITDNTGLTPAATTGESADIITISFTDPLDENGISALNDFMLSRGLIPHVT